MKYFSYDPNGEGFQLHKTEQEAREEAANAIDEERKHAVSEGWNEEVTEICWGEIKEISSITEKRDDGIDYGLVAA